VIPHPFDKKVGQAVTFAVAEAAIKTGVARKKIELEYTV
jgi:malate dehydrogenase (oxaloacetate-decarboxylating)